MSRDKDFKRLVRRRMGETGERYTDARRHEMGVEPGAGARSRRVAYLKARSDRPNGFGTMMQTILADEYVGQRVRFGADVRGDGIEGWAGLWMRVDGAGERMLGFDNMQDRRLTGTFDWRQAEVVLDVSEDAVAFGVLLTGSGALSLANLRFQVVERTVPATKQPSPRHPRNLDFAEA